METKWSVIAAIVISLIGGVLVYVADNMQSSYMARYGLNAIYHSHEVLMWASVGWLGVGCQVIALAVMFDAYRRQK